jgi:hypothetical protein
MENQPKNKVRKEGMEMYFPYRMGEGSYEYMTRALVITR